MTIYEVYCILYSNARWYFGRVNILFHMKSHLSPHQSALGSLPKRGPWSVNSINLAQRSTSVLKLRHADNKFSIVHLFTRWLAGSLAHSFIHSFIHLFTCSFICLCCWFCALRLTSFENFCHISQYRNKLLPLSVAKLLLQRTLHFPSSTLSSALSTLFIHLMATFAYFCLNFYSLSQLN